MFSALAENAGDLNSKILAFVALAPVASFGHEKDKDDDLKFLVDHGRKMTKNLSTFEFGPSMTEKAKGKLVPAKIEKRMEESKDSVSFKAILHFA